MMTDPMPGTLVPSANRGRFALNDPTTGRELTCGDQCELWFGGQWIAATIEYSPRVGGYIFIADAGGTCALCIGMRVRVERSR